MVVVTRPRNRADELIRRLTHNGARVEYFPTLEIMSPQRPLPADEVKTLVGQCDIAIFISRNAAQYGLPLVKAAGGWPQAARIAAVGRGTANELARLGLHADLVPETGASSEALLDVLAHEDMAGRNIIIFRGNGGRELLAETLSTRGADVKYLECYRRGLPDCDPTVLTRAWENEGIDAIIATSREGLLNLDRMVSPADRQQLLTTPVYVVSPAMVELCGNLGYNSVVLMESPRDDDVIKALEQHCQHAQ